MDTQKEQQRKRRESKRKRNRKPALLIVAGIALALLVLLLVRWNRPLTEIALQKGEPDRMDAAKDFLLFANDKTLTAKNANGKELFQKTLDFSPTRVFAGDGFAIASDDKQILFTDKKGEQDTKIPLSAQADYMAKTKDGLVVLADHRLIVYDKNGETTKTFVTEDPLLTAAESEGTLLATTARITQESVRGTLYEEKENTLQTAFPAIDDLIIDYKKTGDRMLAATTKHLYILGDSLIQIPVEQYRGMHGNDRIYLLDGQNLKILNPDGTAIKSVKTPADYPHLSADKDILLLWNDTGFIVYDADGEPLLEKEIPLQKVTLHEDHITLFTDQHAVQGTIRMLQKLP